MKNQEDTKLVEFQKFINYKFNNPNILLQALTTPQYGNENNLPHYEILETLGDAVIKLIFTLKIFNKGEDDPGQLTKTKQCLENNRTFAKIASKIKLWRYIYASKNQNIKGISILADIFEAICGAMYIDTNYNLNIIEVKIIDSFIKDWDSFIEESYDFSKNLLLEFLQNKLKFTPTLKYDYERSGAQHELLWVAKNPKILDQEGLDFITLPNNFQSSELKTKKDAEKELSMMILEYLKKNLDK